MNRSNSPRLSIIALALLALLTACKPDDSQNNGGQTLTVYCAHDEVYSRKIIDRFTAETGIEVNVRFDTEATKSLGLTELIIKEKNNPRCDVFWNNQWLGTADLKAEDCLAPYKGPGFERIPDQHKDPDGLFGGFAARLRVYILNEDAKAIAASANGFDDKTYLKQNDLSRFTLAMPLYGTTRTHYTALWHEMGGEALKAWHASIIDRGGIVKGGNASTMQLVADGHCDVGWTDTDDFYAAMDKGKPVTLQPCRTPAGRTICIPNTVAIIKGAKNRDAAERFVDFLLSEEIELALANSPARQIPLGDVDESKLAAEVRQLRQWSKDSIDLRELDAARTECLQWLKKYYKLE